MWWLIFIFIFVAIFAGLGDWYRRYTKKNNEKSIHNHDQSQSSFNQVVLEQNKILKEKKELIFDELNKILFVNNEKSIILNNLNKMLTKFGINIIFFEVFFKTNYLNNLFSIREKLKFCIWSFVECKYNNKFERIESIWNSDINSYFIYLVLENNQNILFVFQDEDFILIDKIEKFLSEQIYNEEIKIIFETKDFEYLEILINEFIEINDIHITDSFFGSDSSQYYEYDYYEDYDFDYEDFIPNNTCFQKAKNYYEILGVSKYASKSEIKKAYRSKAKEWHPDYCKDEKSEEMMKLINEANSVLSDDQKRKEYDYTI